MQPLKPSNKKFGLFFCGIFFVTAIFYYVKSNILISLVCLVFSILFLAAIKFKPGILEPLNTVWFRLGLMLGKVSGPIVMSAVFFLVITPVALGMRLFKRDPLRLKANRLGLTSYWVARNEPPNSFHNQF